MRTVLVLTLLCGLGLVVASGAIADLIGAIGSTGLLVVGFVLLFYAVDLARTAFGRHIPRGRIYYFIVLDVLWVIGSAVVLWSLSVPFTEAGRWIVLLVADAVGLFAVLQYLGLRRLSKSGVEAAPSV